MSLHKSSAPERRIDGKKVSYLTSLGSTLNVSFLTGEFTYCTSNVIKLPSIRSAV